MRCATSLSLIWVLEPSRIAVVARRRDDRWDGPGGVARLLVLSGTTTANGDDGRMSGASRQHQLIETRARTGHWSGHPGVEGTIDGRPRLVAHLPQDVVAAAGQFAGHRQGGPFAAETVPDRLVIVMVRGIGSRRGFCGFEERPAQLRRALPGQVPW
jgi:hypothetical protein